MFPESEEFRFGVHKCRKTILDGVSKGAIYLGGGVLTMFRIMRKLTEMRSVDKIGSTAAFGGDGITLKCFVLPLFGND